MAKEKDLKKKIIKAGIVFLGIVLFFTIVSKTIYTFLLPTVQVGRPSSGRIQEKILASGKVGHDAQLIKAKQVKVQADIEGKVTACYIEEGKHVKAGEALFELTGTLEENVVKQQEQQRVEIGINKESLAREKAEYEKQLAKAKEALQEKKEEIATQGKSYEIIQLEEQIASKQTEIACNESLYESGALSEQEYNKAKEDLNLLILQKEKQEKAEKQKQKDELDELQTKVTLIESNLAANAEKMQLEDNKLLTQKAEGKSQIVTSPIDGVVYEVDAAVGASVMAHDQLMLVVPDDIPITLSFNISDTNSDKIKLDGEVTWTLNQQRNTAIVKKKKYDDQTQSMIITSEIDAELADKLIEDYKTYKSVDVEYLSATDVYDLLVPNSAIVHEGASTYVYTLQDDSTTFEQKYRVVKNLVTVVKEGNYTSAISGTLNQQDIIVIATSKVLRDGAEVKKQ